MKDRMNRLLTFLSDHLDISKSLYEKAANRHCSLGDWLHRPESRLLRFGPDVRPQGSFRYGTVNIPLNKDDTYDLDNVCVLTLLSKGDLTQKELKRLYGEEIKAYAKAHNMLAPVEEHNRCWRLVYADDVNFHLDTLPCVPEDFAFVQSLIARGVPMHLANCAIAITDRKHPNYEIVSRLWHSSNPRGFARFFESQAARGRQQSILENRAQASIEEVPAYEWKTPLQLAIQIMKRHRDVMFRNATDLAPISMIITNLATVAYEGETDIYSVLVDIVEKMPSLVQPTRPRVPNPADPAEDYADKWSKDARLETNFWKWHFAFKIHLQKLPSFIEGSTIGKETTSIFEVKLTQKELEAIEPRPVLTATVASKASVAPSLYIPSAPKPWGRNG